MIRYLEAISKKGFLPASGELGQSARGGFEIASIKAPDIFEGHLVAGFCVD